MLLVSRPIGSADQPIYSKRTSGWSGRSSSCLDRPLAQTSSSRADPSPSKAYQVIDRFSEDVDLTFDIRALIPGSARWP